MNDTEYWLLAWAVMATIVACLLALVLWVGPPSDAEEDLHEALAAEEEEYLDSTAAPQPIDPHNPPRYVVWDPPVENLDRPNWPRCSCHGRPIRKGETILRWPIPGHPQGGMDIWCEETYTAPNRGRR